MRRRSSSEDPSEVSTAALLLRDLGFHVDVYERTPTPLDGRGSGIVLQPDTVRWFAERSHQDLSDLHTATEYVQYLDAGGAVIHREPALWTYTSWGTFYRALLSDFGTEHYHYGEFACGFDQDADTVTVRFVSGRTTRADLVVFADGITSPARAHFDPEAALARIPDTSAGEEPSRCPNSARRHARCSAMRSPTPSFPTLTSPCTRYRVRTASTNPTA